MSQGLLVATFGATAQLDAFILVMMVPTLVAVPIGGTVELAFGPGMARVGAARSYVRGVLRWSAVRAVSAAVGMTLCAPVLVFLCAPGATAEQREIATDLAYIAYPAIVPMVITTTGASLLVAVNRLATPVFIQGMRPLALIIAVTLVTDPSPTNLAVAVAVSSLVEAIAMLFVLQRLSVDDQGRSESELRSARRGVAPLLSANALNQTAPIIDQAFAASLGPGVLVHYALATRLYDVAKVLLVVPVARLGQNAIARVSATPEFAAEEVRRQRNRSLLVGGLSGLALAVGGPLVLLIGFTNGDFSDADAWATARIVIVLAGALSVYGVATLLSRALVVVGERSSASLLLGTYVVMTLLLDLGLARTFGAPGIAAATAIALAISALASSWFLKRTRSTPAGAT